MITDYYYFLADFESIIVRTISEDFNRDDVEVSLEWVPDSSLHTYHVNITPQPAFSMKLKRNSIRLKVEYNVLYNVSIVTVSPCGQTVTINEISYYGEFYIRDQLLLKASCNQFAIQWHYSVYDIHLVL